MRALLAMVMVAATSGLALAQSGKIVLPVAPAEITTTIPPSTTSPDEVAPKPFPPSNVPPRSRTEQVDQSSGRQQAQSITTPSITRPDVPAAASPSKRALCYEQKVFNPNTFEYEWQQACD